MVRKLFLFSLTALSFWLPSAVSAQQPKVTARQVDCVPLEHWSIARADVRGHSGGDTVRLYFRRFHHLVEDFYWAPMLSGPDGYWAPLPKPEDYKPRRFNLDDPEPGTDPDVLWAAWWKAKEASDDRDPNGNLDDDVIRERASVGKKVARDWMQPLDLDALEEWLEGLDNEPVEYYATVVDANGREVARSPMLVAPVTDDCRVELMPQEDGRARNQDIGETAAWQEGEGVFHWLCDGIVTRVNNLGIARADEICRACVVAWWQKREVLLPAAAGIAGITTIIITEEPNPSPIRP